MTIPEPGRLKWRGKQVYRCRLCAYDAFDKATYETHYQRAHAPLDAMAARRQNVDDLHKMTREELNSYAGWSGVTTDAEDFANKAELIAAIEAAREGK